MMKLRIAKLMKNKHFYDVQKESEKITKRDDVGGLRPDALQCDTFRIL